MSKDFVRTVLREHAEQNMVRRPNLWPAISGEVLPAGRRGSSLPVISWRPAALSVAFVGLIIAVGALFVLGQPQPVSAEEVLALWEKASKNNYADTISSGYMVTNSRYRQFDTEEPFTDVLLPQLWQSRTEVWYQAPANVLGKIGYTTPDGSLIEGYNLETADATYATLAGHEEIRIMERGPNAPRAFSPLDLGQLLAGSGTPVGPVTKTYTTTLIGTEEVAGRMAYVLEKNVTPEVLEAEARGGFKLYRHKYRLWIDRQLYLVLRLQSWSKGGELVDDMTTEKLELNIPVNPGLFEFQPPAGYLVADMRPATAVQVRQGWRDVARQMQVTLYEPGAFGWYSVQRLKPYYVASQGVVTQAIVRKTSGGGQLLHALVVQGLPSAIDESRLGDSTPVQVGRQQGRLYRKNAAYYLVFDLDGTRILLYSSNAGEVERDLVDVGESLAPVATK